MKRIIEGVKARQIPATIFFVGFSKAFDSFQREREDGNNSVSLWNTQRNCNSYNKPFFVGSPEPSNDAYRHFQEDFINNFNSAIETAETKLMGNICELKDDITELKRNTDKGRSWLQKINL